MPDSGSTTVKQYKAIFFDWDDTIGDFRQAAKRSLCELFDKYISGYFTDFSVFYELFQPHNRLLWELYGEQKVTKDYLEFDRFFYPMMMGGVPLEEAVRLSPTMAKEHLGHTTEFFSLLPDAENVVRTLSKKYPLVIVSNGFQEVQYPKIKLSGLKDCFADVVLSEEVGVPKPSAKIYEIALRRGGWQPDEVLMIGDTWSSDIQGGIDQLWVQSDLAGQDPDLPATYKVARLKDCLSLLI